MCFDTAPGRFEVDISNTSEYPEKDGIRPLPQVIAYGHTLADPPYWQEKRVNHPGVPMPAKRFPMISVYDGQRIGYGRVVVDSTWHHWMGMNIDGLEAAAAATDASAEAEANWEKIRAYYVNIAVWLATAHQRNCMTAFHISASHFQYVGFEEFVEDTSLPELGRALSKHLYRRVGPCWTRNWVLDLVLEIDPKLHDMLRREYLLETLPPKDIPKPGPVCLSCPPWDIFEAHVLGGIVRNSIKQHRPQVEQFTAQKALEFRFNEKEDDALLLDGVRAGLQSFDQTLQQDMKQLRPMLSALKAIQR
jgi:hypothetical protein